MRQTHGQEITTNEMRLIASAIAKRFGWALGGGSILSVLTVLFFGPKDLLNNVVAYLWYMLVFRVRLFLAFEIRFIDIHNIAKYYSFMMHQAGFWWVLATVFIVSSLSIFGLLTWIFWRRRQNETLDYFRRGTQLIPANIHNKIMKATYTRKPPHDMGTPLKLGEQKIIIPEALQYRHFAFAGASGYGKSTAIEELLAHAQKHNHKAVLVDLNGAFYAKFGRPGDRLLSLRDARSLAWDFWHEPLATPENIAAAIIETNSKQNQSFGRSARQVLAALLRMNKSLESLIEDLERPQAELKNRLQAAGELACKIIVEGDYAYRVIGTAALDLAFCKQLAHNNGDRTPFSISTWMNDANDTSWVFLTTDDAGLEISKPILRVWFELASLAVLSRSPLQGKHPHTWLVIDETKSVGQLPSLPAILDKGRKHNVSVVLGFQEFSQIKRFYGEHDANSIFQGLQNQFFFRMTDANCAKYASDILGEQDLEQAGFGTEIGIKNTSDLASINHSRTRRKIVLPETIRKQEVLHAYAKLCHHQPIVASFSLSQAAIVNKHFVPIADKDVQTCVAPSAPRSAKIQAAPPVEFGMFAKTKEGG